MNNDEMPVNEYYMRCAWDRTCQERDNLKIDVKVLTAIKNGLYTSLSEALNRFNYG